MPRSNRRLGENNNNTCEKGLTICGGYPGVLRSPGHQIRIADGMAFAESLKVQGQLLENILPHVGVLAVGAPINDEIMIQAAIRRSQTVVSNTGHRATVAEAAKAEIEKDEFLNMKLNQNGVYVRYAWENRVVDNACSASAAVGGVGAPLAAAPGWALAMQAALQADIQATQAALRADIRVLGVRVEGLETSVARLRNQNVHAPADALVPIPGALAPFAMPAAAQPVVHFPANLAEFGALTTAQVSGVLVTLTKLKELALPCRRPALVLIAARALRL